MPACSLYFKHDITFDFLDGPYMYISYYKSLASLIIFILKNLLSDMHTYAHYFYSTSSIVFSFVCQNVMLTIM